jgi:putative restriction endonuclease
MRTSSQLTIGTTYSREELAQRFDIKDATLFTGIFRPKGHESIWLFVTQNKTPDRTQYKDELAGDDLFIEGQTSCRKDKLLAEHFENDLEVLLFYRESKYEFEQAAFKYEGGFRYADQTGKGPTRFHFRRDPHL